MRDRKEGRFTTEKYKIKGSVIKMYRRLEDLDWNVKACSVPTHKNGHYTGRVYVRGWKALSNVLARKDVLAQPIQTSNRRLESCRASPMHQQLWGQSQHSNTGSCFLWGLESIESPWPTHTRNRWMEQRDPADETRWQCHVGFLWSVLVTMSQDAHRDKLM